MPASTGLGRGAVKKTRKSKESRNEEDTLPDASGQGHKDSFSKGHPQCVWVRAVGGVVVVVVEREGERNKGNGRGR